MISRRDSGIKEQTGSRAGGHKSYNGQMVWTCLEERSGPYGSKVAEVGGARQDAPRKTKEDMRLVGVRWKHRGLDERGVESRRSQRIN